jgi:hypothetical protein
MMGGVDGVTFDLGGKVCGIAAPASSLVPS